MAKCKQTSPYMLLFCLTIIVISCTEARKLLPERNVMQDVHSTISTSSVTTTDDNRPTSPGHSPGIGHKTLISGKIVEKNY